MTCREVVELVTDYMDGALSWRRRRQFEKHLADCPDCTRFIEQMRVTIRTLRRLGSAGG